MAKDQDVTDLEYGEIVELTNDDIESFTFAVLNGSVEIVVDDVAPSEINGWPYVAGTGEADRNLRTYSSTGSRVFGVGRAHPSSRVLVTHA